MFDSMFAADASPHDSWAPEPRTAPPERSTDCTQHDDRPGRDQLLDQIASRPAGTVLEVGCGTGRNLCVLDELAPHHTLYGLEPSLGKLATARDKLERKGCTPRISLARGPAAPLRPNEEFGGDAPFDVIFFSYVLSTLPAWPSILDDALSHLAPEGSLYIVEHWEQPTPPATVSAALQGWLRLFDAGPHPDLLRTLRALDPAGNASCSATSIARRSALLVTIPARSTAPPDSPEPTVAPSRRTNGRPAPQQFRSERVISA